MVLMTATNLFSVSSYGEFEFWFAGIKVAAIIVFIGLGSLFVLGLWPNKSTGLLQPRGHTVASCRWGSARSPSAS